jgi:plasmid stabilization system protein ParE
MAAPRATADPETDQWTIRGWPKGLAMFHKNSCRCCNKYVAHTINTCKEQGFNLPIQAVSDAITMAWLALMRALEPEARARALRDYKDLADDAAHLKADLKVSQAALDSERSRVERWDKTIRDLKDEIAALKRPPSTVSVDDDIVGTTRCAVIAHCRALLTPDGPPASTSPLRARGPVVKTRVSISH